MTTLDRSRWDRETAGYVAQLEDAVVAAACVVFDEAQGPEVHSLTEGIHLMASELVNTVPRLKGGYKGAESNV